MDLRVLLCYKIIMTLDIVLSEILDMVPSVGSWQNMNWDS